MCAFSCVYLAVTTLALAAGDDPQSLAGRIDGRLAARWAAAKVEPAAPTTPSSSAASRSTWSAASRPWPRPAPSSPIRHPTAAAG